MNGWCNMRSLATSLLLAVVVVGISAIGATLLAPTREFPWHVFVAVLWVPMILVMAWLGRAPGGAFPPTLIVILAILMWCVLIDAGRLVWRRWRRSS